MPTRSNISGLDVGEGRPGPAMAMGVPELTDQESSDRERLASATQWLGLLDVTDEYLIERAGGRPLVQTLDDLEQIERSAEDLEGIATRLRQLRSDLRQAIGTHTIRHDERRDQRLAKDRVDEKATERGMR